MNKTLYRITLIIQTISTGLNFNQNSTIRKIILLICSTILYPACSGEDGISPEDPTYPPTVSTADIIDITENSATSGGIVTDDGGETISVRGVVWATSENPTINHNKTNDGSGVGTFTSNIINLQPETTYYVRAYATNDNGTSYGNQVSFRTKFPTGTLTDIDGNVYQTVKIGDQWWMAENLRTSRYADGTSIQTNLNDRSWARTSEGAYAIYPNSKIEGLNSEEEVVQAYGKLYNWYAVNDPRGICPDGWHVPSETEWNILENLIGGETVAAGKLKSKRIEPEAHPRWKYPNTSATNQYSWSGLPGGSRHTTTGEFSSIENTGYWWSSTETYDYYGHGRSMFYNYPNVGQGNLYKRTGMSVRCIMD